MESGANDITKLRRETRTFYATDHDRHSPLGVATVVMAEDEQRARELVDAALYERGLRDSDSAPYTLEELLPNTAVVLGDGDLAH